MKRLIFFVFIASISIHAQNYKSMDKEWFISSAIGLQMSGIKSEDFIGSNIAPLFQIGIGVWFTREIALQLEYKGNYFHTISDKNRHYYNFLLGEVLLNINEIINGNKVWGNRWSIILYSGAGYFYNVYYYRPNICGNFGIKPSMEITKYVKLYVDISAIVGWDIYQGDDDILPSCALGLSYLL